MVHIIFSYTHMLYTEKPHNFSPLFETAGCYIEWDGKFLILLRAPHKKVDPHTWNLPAGKIEKGEEKEDGVIREVREETGLSFSPQDFEYLCETYCRYTECDFVYYMFRVKIKEEPNIILNEEHTDYAWVTPQEALKRKLIRDEDAAIRLVYGDMFEKEIEHS